MITNMQAGQNDSNRTGRFPEFEIQSVINGHKGLAI